MTGLAVRLDTREGARERAASEFLRAHAAFEQAMRDGLHRDPVLYYRLRDVALASVDLAQFLLDDGGRMPAAIALPLQELRGLTTAHVLGFMSAPPERVLHSGRAAATLIAAVLDSVLGDSYAPRGR